MVMVHGGTPPRSRGGREEESSKYSDLCGLCVSVLKMTSENRVFFLGLRLRRTRKI